MIRSIKLSILLLLISIVSFSQGSSKKVPVTQKVREVKKIGEDYYEVRLTEPFKEYVVKYL